jgi:hypothetical protein
MTDGRKICAVDCCIRVATAGSDFCISHILRDPTQKLFVECPTCHRPFPVLSSCFGCRRD